MTEEIKKEVQLVLNNCQVEGDTIHLPEEPVDTVLFTEIKKLLKAQGGKYNKTAKVFRFEEGHAAKAFACMIESINEKKEPALRKGTRVIDMQNPPAEINLEQLEKAVKKAKRKPKEEMIIRERKEIEVRAAELKDSFFCNYWYDHTIAPNTTLAVAIKSPVPIHEDLRNAFAKLIPHMAVICDEILAEEIGDITFIPENDPVQNKLSLFSVNAFELKDFDAKEGVVLKGEKALTLGGGLGLTTPKITWDSNYKFADELHVAIAELLIEVELYKDGKQAEKEEDPQQELPFGENENVSEENYAEEEL